MRGRGDCSISSLDEEELIKQARGKYDVERYERAKGSTTRREGPFYF